MNISDDWEIPEKQPFKDFVSDCNMLNQLQDKSLAKVLLEVHYFPCTDIQHRVFLGLGNVTCLRFNVEIQPELQVSSKKSLTLFMCQKCL